MVDPGGAQGVAMMALAMTGERVGQSHSMGPGAGGNTALALAPANDLTPAYHSPTARRRVAGTIAGCGRLVAGAADGIFFGFVDLWSFMLSVFSGPGAPLSARKFTRFDSWIPVVLWGLPVFMVLVAAFNGQGYGRAMVLTPIWPIVLEVAIILYVLVMGGFRPLSPAATGKGSALPWRQNRVFVLILGGVLTYLVWATMAFALNPAYGIMKLADLFLALGVALAIAALVHRNGAGYARCLLEGFIGGVILGAVVAAPFIWLRIPAEYNWETHLPGFAHIRIYGMALALAIASAVGLYADAQRGSSRRRVLFVALVVLWSVLTWSGTRGGIAAIIAVLVVLMPFLPRLRPALVPTLIAGVLGAALSLGYGTPGHNYGLFSMISDTVFAENMAQASASRTTLWAKYLEFAFERPLGGHGYAQLKFLSEAHHLERIFVHTHNIILEAALSIGLPLTLLLALTVVTAWVLWVLRARRDGSEGTLSALLMASVFLVHGLVDGTWYYYQALIPFAIAVGVLIARERPGDEGSA